MQLEHNHDPQKQKILEEKRFLFSIRGCITLIIIAIIVFYLIAEHSAHIAGFFAEFPWIFLALLCALMHFMHGGHHDKSKKMMKIPLTNFNKVIYSRRCVFRSKRTAISVCKRTVNPVTSEQQFRYMRTA